MVPKTKLIKETHAGRGRGRECVEVGGCRWSKMECLAPQASKHWWCVTFVVGGIGGGGDERVGVWTPQMGVFFRPDFLAWVCSCEWGGVSMRDASGGIGSKIRNRTGGNLMS